MPGKKDKKKFQLDLKAVGMRLRETREVLGLTLEAMHEVSGFSKSLISEAEKGLKKPSAIYLTALLDHYNVNVNYILSGRGRMFLPTPPSLRPEVDGRRQDLKSDARKFEDLYAEMVYLVEHVDMVKYAMLSAYINYKTLNLSTITKLVAELARDET